MDLYSKRRNQLHVVVATLVLWLSLFIGCAACERPVPPERSVTTQDTAANTQSATAEPPSQVPWSEPFLWRIKSESGDSYLFGTVHLGFDLEKDGPSVILERFAESDRFVTETDLSRAPTVISRYLTLPEGETLSGKLSKEDWALLEERVGDADSFDRQYPFVVVSKLMMELPPDRNPFEIPMDAVLLQAAVRAGHQITYLEPVETQFEVLQEVLDEDMLSEMLNDWDAEVDDYVEMTNAYRQGDPDGVSAIIYQEADDPEERRKLDLLLTNRNREWLPAIVSEVQEGRAFIAVGAGHLVGKDGLIELLKKEGYELEQVTSP